MRPTENQSTRTDTSDAAFARIPRGAATLCLAALRETPRTVDELMLDLGLSHSTCSAAVNKLKRLGWVYDAGYRAVTRSEREAIVWLPRDQPIPIEQSHPTRRQLAERIERAIDAIDRNLADLTHVRQILSGDMDE